MLRNLNYSPVPGRVILGTPECGIVGAAIPPGSIIYDSLSLPADADKFYRVLLLTQPTYGHLTVYENGAIEYDPQGFAGVQTFDAQLYENDAAIGTITVSLNATTSATVTAVTVAPTTATLNSGEQRQLTATAIGTGSPPQTFTWSATLGTVSATGLYTAPAATSVQRTDVVTVASTLNPSATAQATITLAAAPVTQPVVTSVEIAPTSATIAAGSVLQLSAAVIGTNAPPQDVTWHATSGSISGTGLFTAPVTGQYDVTVLITATSVYDGTKVGSALITVMATVSLTGYPDPAVVLSGVQYGSSGEFTGTYVPSCNVLPVSGQFTGQQAIDAVLQRIGRRGQTQYRAAILSEMRIVHEEYSQGPNPPWFLRTTRTLPVSKNSASLILPSDFLRFEDDDAFISYEDSTGLVFPKIVDINVLRQAPAAFGSPRAVALWDKLYLWPVPDKALQLSVTAVYSTQDILDDASAPVNAYLRYAPYVLIAKTAYRAAMFILQDFSLAQQCQVVAQEAEVRLARFTAARRAAGVPLERGDDCYE